jgi:hypothetical protein
MVQLLSLLLLVLYWENVACSNYLVLLQLNACCLPLTELFWSIFLRLKILEDLCISISTVDSSVLLVNSSTKLRLLAEMKRNLMMVTISLMLFQ